MNKKLELFAGQLELCGVLLLLFSALRADGGLSFWLFPALMGMALCLMGLGISWLCSPKGQAFRRRTFGTQQPPLPTAPLQPPLSFSNAG